MDCVACYRFGSAKPALPTAGSILRTVSQKHSSLCFSELLFVGADSEYSFSSSGVIDLGSFMYSLSHGSRLLVLTRKERQLLIASALSKIVTIFCFEEHFPFIKGIRYLGDAKQNYEQLVKQIAKVKSINLEFDYLQNFYLSVHRKLCRKIPFKNSIDDNFFFLPVFPYQEAFRFSETETSRMVIALDFNSMYASAMLGEFPDPKYLYYVVLNREYVEGECLYRGMYQVKLSHPDAFIRTFHALRFVHKLESFPFDTTKSLVIAIT